MVQNSSMVITSVVVALEVDTSVAVALEVDTWVAMGFIVESAVMVSKMEAVPLVVRPCPSCFEGLTLVVILGVGLEAELHRVHSQDSAIKPSSRPCPAKQVLDLKHYLVPLLLLLILV